jgi:hypothetical protein
MDETKNVPSSAEAKSVEEVWPNRPTEKVGHNGIALIPRPSDDPRDPLVCTRNHSVDSVASDF